MTIERVSDDDFGSLIGEGVHAGLRKGSEAPSSHALWKAISESNDGAWGDAVDYCTWGIGYSGYHLVKGDELPEGCVGLVVAVRIDTDKAQGDELEMVKAHLDDLIQQIGLDGVEVKLL
jgi:hypothetical protein